MEAFDRYLGIDMDKESLAKAKSSIPGIVFNPCCRLLNRPLLGDVLGLAWRHSQNIPKGD